MVGGTREEAVRVGGQEEQGKGAVEGIVKGEGWWGWGGAGRCNGVRAKGRGGEKMGRVEREVRNFSRSRCHPHVHPLDKDGIY